MREREAFLCAALGIAAVAGACSRPADPGDFMPGNTTDENEAPNGSVATDPPPTSEPDASTPPPDEPVSDGGSDAGAPPEEDGGAGPTVPDYDPAVIMDDGVLHIWTLGDSITVGVEGGFRNDIYNLLADDGYDVDLVGTLYDDSTVIEDKDHEGHTAYTFELTREDVDGWIAQIHRPDVVLLWLGANDFAWWTNVQPDGHLEYEIDLIDHLLDTLPGAAIVVATLTPQSSEIVEDVHRDRTDMVEEFDGLLRDALEQHPEYGKHVFMADLGARITLADLYDGIHPTREAHTEVAQVWYEVLKEILPSP
jgi:lysophospholipase L1-like esterase